MSEDTSFRDLIRRVRAGDAGAAAELVRRYEPIIRLVVRRRLKDPALRRVLDSLDVCQSVLASFFGRAALGQYDLDSSDDLLKLLATMARNKVVNQVQKQRAARRDYRRSGHDSQGLAEVADRGPGPSQVVANRDLLQQLRDRLSAEERQLADRRAEGQSWEEIAKAVGSPPDAVRMKLRRALDRVAHELGLED